MSALLSTKSGVAAMNTGILSTLEKSMMEVPMPSATAIALYGSTLTMASTVLAAMRGHHVVDVHADFLEVALLQAGAGRDESTKMLPIEEPVWLAIFLPLSCCDLGDVEVLARHDLRGLADCLDLGDGDEAALVMADDEGLPGVGAHVDLTRHHLLHGEIAGRHRELLELDAVLLEQAGLDQVVGRHAPDIGLVALAHGIEREGRTRSPCADDNQPPRLPRDIVVA